MRLRPYFGDTYAGIITVGVGLAAACALVSATMFLFRPLCEPILRIALTIFVQAVSRGYFSYDPDTYWFWDGYIAVLGLFMLAIAIVVVIRKPAQDRLIDEALRRQTTEVSHGAPLDPQ